eukprot:641375-Amphidinium_carterae.1
MPRQVSTRKFGRVLDMCKVDCWAGAMVGAPSARSLSIVALTHVEASPLTQSYLDRDSLESLPQAPTANSPSPTKAPVFK